MMYLFWFNKTFESETAYCVHLNENTRSYLWPQITLKVYIEKGQNVQSRHVKKTPKIFFFRDLLNELIEVVSKTATAQKYVMVMLGRCFSDPKSVSQPNCLIMCRPSDMLCTMAASNGPCQ